MKKDTDYKIQYHIIIITSIVGADCFFSSIFADSVGSISVPIGIKIGRIVFKSDLVSYIFEESIVSKWSDAHDNY